MSKRKKNKKVEEITEGVYVKDQDLNKLISEAVAGLTYMSETDAEILPFAGQKTDSVTKENLLHQIGKSNDLKIEEKDFSEFFEPLLKIQKWFGEDERKMTENFAKLKDLLQHNLIQKKVFRIGKKEIDIYVVGLDAENILRGIQTKAVET